MLLRTLALAFAAAAAAAAPAPAAAGACAFEPSLLTVDFLPSPVGGSPAASFLPRLSSAPAPLLGWRARSLLAPGARGNLSQSAFRVVVATSPALLPPDGTPDVFDSGRVSNAAQVAVPYGGPLLAARARVFWRVETWDQDGASCGFGAETSAWEVPPLSAADWAGAQWLTRDAPHAPPADCDLYNDSAAPLLRAEFSLAQPAASVVRARLYVAGLGYFTPFLDGAQVGDEALAPGWTDFNDTVLFSTFDITAALLAGGGAPSHVLGVALGNGWYDLVPLLFWGHLNIRSALPTGDPMAIALVAIDFADGSTQHVVTSPTGGWRVGASEVLFNSIYLGTRIDRRLEPVGWSTAAFDASGWPAPHAASAAGLGALVSQRAPPVRRQAPLPVTLLNSSSSELTLDIGRQIAGVCTFCFAAGIASGAKIDFRYGELLYPNGSVNGMTSVAGQVKGGSGANCEPHTAFQEDHYTARGDAGGECFTPPFTWHGARYVMVTGDAAALAALDVATTQCHPMRSDMAAISSLDTGSQLLNAVHTATLNTFENNLMSVQSDCPHRERLGYGGDALMSGESFMLNFDMSTFYPKRLDDVVAAQRANGGFTETAPWTGMADAGLGGGSGPIGWETYLPQQAAWLYKSYGDAPTVRRVYDAATRYVEFLDSAPRSAIENGLGDWMPVEDSALPLTGLGFQHVSYLAYANMSAIVGNASQAAKYAAAAVAIADALNEAFLNPATGVYAAKSIFNRTQCGQSMPLFLRIVPPAAVDAAVAALVANLADHDGHLQVGSFGVKYLLMSLVDAGRADLAFGVMNKTDFPSFGYMLNKTVNGLTDATTLWVSAAAERLVCAWDERTRRTPRRNGRRERLTTHITCSVPSNPTHPDRRAGSRATTPSHTTTRCSALAKFTSFKASLASWRTRRRSRSTASSSSPRRRASRSRT